MNIRENLQHTYEQLDLTIESQSRAVLLAASIFEQVAHKVALAVLYFLKGALYSFSLGQIHSVSRSAIPPDFTPIQPETIVTNAINTVISEKEFKEALDKWVSEGAPEEKRQKAADRILGCFLKKETRLNLTLLNLRSLPSCIGTFSQLTYLYLNHNQLISIPDSIAKLTQLMVLGLSYNQLTEINDAIYNLTKLTYLDLSSNQLTKIKDSIGNLTQLEHLDLGSNQFTAIPDTIGNLTQLIHLSLNFNQLNSISGSIGNLAQLEQLQLRLNQLSSLPIEILQLPRNCQVFLDGNPFSEDVLNQLRATRDTGPRFYVSIAGQENQETSSLNLDELVDFWSTLIPNPPEVQPILNLEPKQDSLLTEFLARLGEVEEYRNTKTRIVLAQRITRFLNAFAESEEFRNLSLQIIEESLAFCGDRVSLGLLRIECLWKILSSQNIPLQEVAKLAIGMKRLQMLETIAREKVKNLYFIDEVEVYLAYMTKLASSLALPIDSQDMLFFKISGVTTGDLYRAEKTLIEETSYPKQITEDLLQFEPWIQKIHREFKDEINPQLELIEQDIQAKTDLLEKEKSTTSDQEYNERYKAIAAERNTTLRNLYGTITTAWIRSHYTQLLISVNSTTPSN